MNTYRHAGDIGDVLFSLPVIRYFGGGVLFIEAARYTRQLLTPDKWCGLDVLLKQQPYITDVLPWHGERVTVCLNDFRARMQSTLRRGEGKQRHLADWMMEAHGVPLSEKDKAWLSVEPNAVAPVVINRSGPGRQPHHVYHNPQFPWHRVWKKYHQHAVFIGHPEEHAVFTATCGEVPYHPTADLYEAARVIAGASLFIGNQSACHAIAEGLKRNILLEVWPSGANTLSYRPGVTHGWDLNIQLPDLSAHQEKQSSSTTSPTSTASSAVRSPRSSCPMLS